MSVNYTSTPAGGFGTVQTPYSSSTFTPAGNVHSFKIPVTVVFVTGMSLVMVNNIGNGKIPEIWKLLYDGQAIENFRQETLTLVGEIIFVLVVSFLAEISGAVSDIAFALFVSLWIVWSMNNSDKLLAWTANIRSTNAATPIAIPAKK